jgi:hypothetical protein
MLTATSSTKNFSGICSSPWLWFDIDHEHDLDRALSDTRRLATTIAERYQLGDGELLIFFSGSNGFHLGLPTTLWSPVPTDSYRRVCRRLAETLAESAGVTIDVGVYDRCRAFRAPNSRHPKTGKSSGDSRSTNSKTCRSTQPFAWRANRLSSTCR